MRTRRIYFAAALAAAAAIGAGITYAISGPRVTPVTETITIPGTDIVWAPPPADAQPALTADEAYAKFSHGHSLGWGATVQLGSLTDPVGPYCGVSCDMWRTVDGISYRAYKTLAYGYYGHSCPPDSQDERDCQTWTWLDVNTGKMITGVGPRM
jgi:hypothetical protein